MSSTLSSEDIAALSAEQQKAILEALFLSVGIDREVDSEERKRFRKLAEEVPWTLEPAATKKILEDARDRVQGTTDQDAFLKWIGALAGLIVGQDLQVKVLRMMATLAMIGDFDRSERGLLNAFIMEFKLPAEVIDELKKEFGRA